MRKHILIVTGIVLVIAIGILVYLGWPDRAKLGIAEVTGPRPRITEPRPQIIPTVNIAKPVGWTNGARPTPAPGLNVGAFATGLNHPRWLYRLPNGDVLVAETNSPPRPTTGISDVVMKSLMSRAGAGGASPSRITLLRDADGDGVAESRSVLMSGLDSPLGMALSGGMLYIANTDALVRVPFRVGQTKVTATPEIVVRYPGGGHHWARGLIAAPDGRALYVSVGSSTNIADNGLEAEVNRANILQVDPVNKGFRIFAGGLRNPQGMAFEPQSQRLWTVVNERDMLGSDLAPDYLTAVGLGDFFGWPYSYWGGYVDKRVQPERPDLLEYSKRPDYALGAHTASLGLTFAAGARLGDRFANGAFIGQHGSWNRVPASGYKVIYVPFAANGFPVKGTQPIDVLTGFLDAKGRAQGRPVGVEIDGTGALLVADDVGNVIWRVSAG